jgi:arylsulfatase A-like enzyme
MILIAPQLNKQKKFNDQISTIDIFPTIFDIIEHPEYNINSNGKTLLPLINEKDTHTSYAFIDSIANSPKQNLSNLIGIRTLEYKYCRNRNDKTKSVYLYNLKKDPLEEINIAQENSKLIEKFENMLNNINSSMNFNIKTSNIKTDKESKDVQKVLRDLGYI